MKNMGWYLKNFWKMSAMILPFFIAALSFSLAFGANLNLGEGTGTPGTDVTIPVTLVTGGSQIAAAAMDIGYNTALLENPRVAIGPAGTTAGKQVVSSTPSSGVFRIGVLSIANNNAIGDGVVANVTFGIKGGAPSGDTPLSNIPSASNPSGSPVSVSGTNGVIHIQGAPPPPSAELNLGSGSGSPGGSATIPIALVTHEASIAATANDLGYSPAQLLNPRAEVGPAGAAAGKVVVSNVVSPGLFRVGVLSLQNNNPIGDGVVANVTFDIAPTVPIGTEIGIDNTPSASDPNGNLVPVIGTDGVIHVVGVEIRPSTFSSILQGVHGFAGVQGQWPLEVIGGTAPYSWSIIQGGLPNGVGLDGATGLISGRPLEFGEFPFRVRVADAHGYEGIKDLLLRIALLGDVNGDGLVMINELQVIINSYLGMYPPAD